MCLRGGDREQVRWPLVQLRLPGCPGECRTATTTERAPSGGRVFKPLMLSDVTTTLAGDCASHQDRLSDSPGRPQTARLSPSARRDLDRTGRQCCQLRCPRSTAWESWHACLNALDGDAGISGSARVPAAPSPRPAAVLLGSGRASRGEKGARAWLPGAGATLAQGRQFSSSVLVCFILF